ncbi:transcriptional regulator, ArsR family [Octadecabacter temperatus]|uniref:Arsenate-mycothiol transferase ArsC1 n=1 Tax=Octadecabacter temperatus TaxID=1458307 RepID=A0A0K0Y7W5_9RHOB|nr:ArsR family transcriptional regulator [Octadecabacter temperatus]AKS47064.1 Arsenate-mycothiol transferase ArsC1 [Octadecabacter temperatus]SIO46889.1 transcriptional regulator, ArsR family [Octadecabacter temperatus]
MDKLIPDRLSTLGYPQRLAVFRLLMRRYPDRVPATELANALDLKPNTLSSYVSALMQTGLISQERIGTSLRYAVDMEATQATIGFLIHDCCRGRPEICSPFSSDTSTRAPEMTDQKFNVLFICTGNSARSIFAEAILRDLAPDRFNVYSAGTKPQLDLNPFALDLLAHNGHDVSALRAKNIGEFQTEDALAFDFVFTVCDQAANEDCPAWQGQTISAHWGLPDPVKVEGTDAEKSLAFRQTYGALRNRMTGFTALPIASLDRISLQKAVDDIGQIKNEG